jgi:hypothetical protein
MHQGRLPAVSFGLFPSLARMAVTCRLAQSACLGQLTLTLADEVAILGEPHRTPTGSRSPGTAPMEPCCVAILRPGLELPGFLHLAGPGAGSRAIPQASIRDVPKSRGHFFKITTAR